MTPANDRRTRRRRKPDRELLLEALRVLDRSVIDVELELRALRSLARESPRDRKRHRARSGRSDEAHSLRPQGRDDHAGRQAATSVPQRHPAPRDRRQGHRANGTAHSRRASGRRHPRADLRSSAWPSATPTARRNGARAKGGSEIAFRTETIERSVCRVVSEYAFEHAERMGAKGLRRPEVHGQPGVRRHAQRRDGCGGRAASRTCVRAAADRRNVRIAAGEPTESIRSSYPRSIATATAFRTS